MPHLEIKIKDKIIRADGLCGRIVKIQNTDDGIPDSFVIEYENGTAETISLTAIESRLGDFYLIGKTVLGNKIEEQTLTELIEAQRTVCQAENQKLDTLRKQLWTHKNLMRPDWKEHMNGEKSLSKKTPPKMFDPST